MATIRSARLSGAEQEAYRRDGYVIRERVFTGSEVRDLTSACESLIDRLVRDRKGQRVTFGSYVFDSDIRNRVIIKWEGDSDVVHGVEPFAHLSPELERWAYDPRFIDPMRDLLGIDDPRLFTEKLNLKRPRRGGGNALHQDYPYWWRVAENADEVATAMLFLDDASMGNGCLQVVPGSHLDGAWKGRTDGDYFAANEIDRAFHGEVNLVPVEVPSGSVVMFGPFLVHQSAPNMSSQHRRALLFSYQPPGRRTQLDALSARLGRSSSPVDGG